MFVGGYIAEKAKAAGSKINEKIDESEKMSSIKNATAEKLG